MLRWSVMMLTLDTDFVRQGLTSMEDCRVQYRIRILNLFEKRLQLWDDKIITEIDLRGANREKKNWDFEGKSSSRRISDQ